MVEENLAESIEKKNILKEERQLLIEARLNGEADKNRMKRLLNLCVFVAVILFAALVLVVME